MRYILGIIIFCIFSSSTFIVYKRIAKEVNKAILKEVKEKGYKSYPKYIKEMQKEEDKIIRKNRNRKRMKKYQKKSGLW